MGSREFPQVLTCQAAHVTVYIETFHGAKNLFRPYAFVGSQPLQNLGLRHRRDRQNGLGGRQLSSFQTEPLHTRAFSQLPYVFLSGRKIRAVLPDAAGVLKG